MKQFVIYWKFRKLSTAFVAIILLCISTSCTRTTSTTATKSSSEKPATTQPTDKPRIVEYQPGIRIDFDKKQVELSAKVILRKAELELFAYSRAPTPKEHETILITEARPLYVYQALGLIGLTPGHPMSYDADTGKTISPTGDAVDVLVRYEDGVNIKEHSACDWMWDMSKKLPMTRQHWLFTGSRKIEGDRFGADFEGTLVTVVNFDTALLSLPELHSDSNSELWLTANTDAIPPVGTPVTLILRAVK